jgi:hypothetical protein
MNNASIALVVELPAQCHRWRDDLLVCHAPPHRLGQNALPSSLLLLRVFAQMQPWHALFWKYVSCRPKSRSFIECADMNMHFR